MPGDGFITKYPIKSDKIIAEAFIEGTMINVFYDSNYGVNGCWQIATRNTVGGEVSFYKTSNGTSNKTFNEMFMDACIFNNFNLQLLNPRFCYSFVLQHPENRIVVPFKFPQLYLISVYKIDNTYDNITISEENLKDEIDNSYWNMTGIKFPDRYEFASYTELIEKFASANTPYLSLIHI